jgi:hypothetical protein
MLVIVRFPPAIFQLRSTFADFQSKTSSTAPRGRETWGWVDVTPVATALTTQCLAEQRIPDLPQACGPNCRYKVSVLSFVFQCTPNPSSLPYNQAGNCPDPPDCTDLALWNGTTDPSSMWAFYVAWSSNKWNGTDWSGGTSGNAHCSPVQAQYDVEVRTIALFT